MRKTKVKGKENLKGQKAITLIALVITIIVLLILAGISIATLTGENGLLTKANTAKEQTEIASEKEIVELSAVGALTKDNGGEIKRNYLNDELTSNIGIEGTDYTLSESETAPFVVTYLDSGRSYLIDENGDISEYVDISKDVKIGDYVDYHPTEVKTPYDKFGETYTGYANATDIGQDSLKWRVLNINLNGTVDLISASPTSKSVYFKGARGYNNGVAILNDYCKTMYSNASKGAVARSLNIEDIQDKMIEKVIDEETEKKGKEYEKYKSGTGTVYKTGTYPYSSNKWYPLKWKEDNGIEGESEPKTPTSSDIISYASEDNAKDQEKTQDLTVTQTYWYLDASTMSTNFETANTRDTTKTNSMYYELLCNNGSSYYWLASRYVDAFSSSCAYFGLRYVNGGDVDGIYVFYSNSRPYSDYLFVRPVVSLPSNVIDLNTNYETVGKWNLK